MPQQSGINVTFQYSDAFIDAVVLLFFNMVKSNQTVSVAPLNYRLAWLEV